MEEPKSVDFIDNKYTRIYYQLVYRAKQRKLGGYKERHHIIPRSMGGSNGKENLCDLTPREHFLCHWLLTKMTTGISYSKMCLALHLMCTGKDIHLRYAQKITSRLYSEIKLQVSEYMRIVAQNRDPISDETRNKLSQAFYKNTKINSIESIEKRRLKRLGHDVPQETREKIRNTLRQTYIKKGFKVRDPNKVKVPYVQKGKKLSEETKAKMRKPKSIETKEKIRLASIAREAKKKEQGYIFPESVKLKLREKYTCIHCGYVSNKSTITRLHNKNCKAVLPDSV